MVVSILYSLIQAMHTLIEIAKKDATPNSCMPQRVLTLLNLGEFVYI